MDINFLASKLKNLPETSWVYLMKDVSGKVIYVGKAINLKRRSWKNWKKKETREW